MLWAFVWMSKIKIRTRLGFVWTVYCVIISVCGGSLLRMFIICDVVFVVL